MRTCREPSLTSVTVFELRSASCQRLNRRHRDDDRESQANFCGYGIMRICLEEQNLIEVKVHLQSSLLSADILSLLGDRSLL